jgi:hypothetical protein
MTDQGAETKFEVVKAAVENNIKTFRAKRDFNRTRAFGLRLAIVAIGALTTICLGLKPYASFSNSDAILSSVALLLSASVPLLAAWEAFFDHRWLWIRYTGTLNSLYAIRDELDFTHAAGEIKEAQLDSLFSRFQNTLGEVDSDWSKQRKDALRQQAEPQKK